MYRKEYWGGRLNLNYPHHKGMTHSLDTAMNSERHAEFLQAPPRYLLPGVFLLAALGGLIIGVMGRAQAPEAYRQALVVLALLSSVINAALAVIVFPYVFTAISRRFGAVTNIREVRALSAVSLVFTLVCLILATITGMGVFSVLGGILSTLVFIYGLSLVNGTDVLGAARHTLAVWGVMLLFSLLLAVLLRSL